MRLLFSAIMFWCITFCTATSQQVPLAWSQPLAITTDTSYGSLRPRIAVADNGNIIVTWGKSDSVSRVYYAVKTPSGSFSTPQLVSPSGVNCRVAETDGPSISSKGNVVYIVYTTWPFATTHSYSRKSTDGGLTWASPVQVDGYLSGNLAMLPHITIDHVYNPHAAMVRVTPAGSNPVAGEFCSVDQGGSYVSFVPGSTLTVGNSQDCSLPFQVTSGSTHMIVYRNNNSGLRQVYAAKSLNNGATFTSITSVDNTPWNSPSCIASSPEAYIWNDTLITVWMTASSGVKQVRASATRISSLTASPSRLLDSVQASVGTEQDHPVIIGSGTIVGVAWQAKAPTDSNSDAAVAVSVTGYGGLNFPEVINAGTTSSISEKFPSIAYHDSTFHFVYVDAVQSRMFHVSASLRSSTTSVRETGAAAPEVFIYPNPARQSVIFSHGSQPAVVFVYDLLGRLVAKRDISAGNTAIDISSLPTGLYLYRLEPERGIPVAGKLVKIR